MPTTNYTVIKGRTEATSERADLATPGSPDEALAANTTVYRKQCAEGSGYVTQGRGSRLEFRDEGSVILDEPYYVNFVGSAVTVTSPDGIGTVVTIGSPETSITGFIELPLVKAYPLLSDAHHTWDLIKITGRTASGTCDFAVKIDGTTVTGMSGTFTSTEGSFSASGSYSVTVGERVTLDISAISSPADLEFTMVSQRTSA